MDIYLCLTDMETCRSYPCMNGGQCINLVDAFRCDCPVDFTDRTCSTRKSIPLQPFPFHINVSRSSRVTPAGIMLQLHTMVPLPEAYFSARNFTQGDFSNN